MNSPGFDAARDDTADLRPGSRSWIVGNLSAPSFVLGVVVDVEEWAISGTDSSDDWLSAAYEEHRLGLFRLARLLTGSDPSAEDVVQDAFMRLKASRRVPDDPRAYLRASVLNLCRNRARRMGLERRTPRPVPLPLHNPEVDDTWKAIRELPFRQRAVIVLRFYEDMTEAEIATTLRWPKGTVKSTLHRALARLRKDIHHD